MDVESPEPGTVRSVNVKAVMATHRTIGRAFSLCAHTTHTSHWVTQFVHASLHVRWWGQREGERGVWICAGLVTLGRFMMRDAALLHLLHCSTFFALFL